MVALLGLLSLVAMMVSAAALIRGRLEWAHIQNRRHAGLALAGSFAVLVGAFAATPPATPARPATVASAPQPTVTVTTQVTVTPTPSETPTPTPTPIPTPTPTSTPVVTPPPAPVVTTPAPQVTLEASVQPRPTTQSTTQSNFVGGAKPTTKAPVAQTTTKAPAATKPKAASYANCSAARAAGAAPLYRGQPGYSSKLDRDGDGVACE